MTTQELHVVYGVGPTGTSVVEELVARGKHVRVVSRSGDRGSFPSEVEVVRGDATDPVSTQATSAGASHVYNTTNARDYHKWPEQFPPLQRGVLEGAAANGARLIVMENLYMYGPHGGVPMTEAMPMRGHGSRSTTRIQMTNDLLAAHRSGKVQALSVRASDLYGPGVRQSLVGADVFNPLVAGKPVQLQASLDVPHSVTFIRDVGRAMVTLGQDERAFGQAWHVPNAPATTLREFLTMAFAEAGFPPRMSSLPRSLTRLLLPVLGLAVPPVRGLEENLYILYEPYIVDHSKFARAYGDSATPLEQGIRETVAWYRQLYSAINVAN